MIMLDGCMESKLASAWPEGEISIDGKGGIAAMIDIANRTLIY